MLVFYFDDSLRKWNTSSHSAHTCPFTRWRKQACWKAMVRTMLYGKEATPCLCSIRRICLDVCLSLVRTNITKTKSVELLPMCKVCTCVNGWFPAMPPPRVLINRTAVQVLVYANGESLPLHSSFTLCIYVVRCNYKNFFVSPVIYSLRLN